MTMKNPKSLVWLITGCSSGFGNSLCLTALRAGHRVIATSRSPSSTPQLVQEVEKLGGAWMTLDVNVDEEKIYDLVEAARGKYGRIDVLVNTAGVGLLGAIEDTSCVEAEALMNTNYFGPFKTMKAVLPIMRGQRNGTIVNVSSAAGVQPRASMSVYAASKWALEGISEGLAKEVAPFGIRVLIVQPGSFTTNMMNAVRITEAPMTEAYRGTEVGAFVNFFGESPIFSAPNDVDKGCQAIFEVVTGIGRGTGKEQYIRLPLSADVAQRTKEHIDVLRKGLDTFEDIWRSTGHDGGVSKAFPKNR